MYDYQKYRYADGIVKVVRFIIHDDEPYGNYYAVNETEKQQFIELCQSENPTVTEVDTTGYDWIDGCKLPENDIDLAVEMGQVAYEQYIMDSDPTYQMLELDMRVALLELGLTQEDLTENSNI